MLHNVVKKLTKFAIPILNGARFKPFTYFEVFFLTPFGGVHGLGKLAPMLVS
jgi:hypothetical protein